MTTTDAFASDCVCTSSIPSTELIADSKGFEIRFSTSSGAASSYVVATTATGKSISGNRSMTNPRKETTPSAIMAMTIMMTPTGRFTDVLINFKIYYPLSQLQLYCHLSV